MPNTNKSGKYKLGGLIVKRNKPASGKCRVESCKFYHRSIKNLSRHLKRHGMTIESHSKLAESKLCVYIQQKKKHVKGRKVELCSEKGCFRYMEPFTDLTRHLRKVHGISKKEYYEKRKFQSLGPAVSEFDILGKDDANDNEEMNSKLESDEISDDERSVLDSDVTLSSPLYPETSSPNPKKDQDITARRCILQELQP